jgi:hypothetical protein
MELKQFVTNMASGFVCGYAGSSGQICTIAVSTAIIMPQCKMLDSDENGNLFA